MNTNRRTSKTSSLLLSALMSVPLLAQSTPPQSPPLIEVNGSGESKVAPDRALILIGVQSRARTAALAGQENARLATAILDAIRGAGIARDQISTLNYNVAPSYRYFPDGRKPELTGYDASNTVRVEIRSLDLVGKVIDASLAAGATNINGVTFYASQLDAVKRDALGRATIDARLNAEAIAKAAGGSLGPLLSVSSQMTDVQRPMPMMAMAARKSADEATPIEAPTEQIVSATVVARFTFIPSAPPR
jgi:uncharacterized protein